jgi:hypothetical protein
MLTLTTQRIEFARLPGLPTVETIFSSWPHPCGLHSSSPGGSQQIRVDTQRDSAPARFHSSGNRQTCP